LITPQSKSLTKIRKRIGPSTDPWGTPLITSIQADPLFSYDASTRPDWQAKA